MHGRLLSENSRQMHYRIAQRLQKARRVSNTTQTAAARVIGVSEQQYKKYEMGISRISAIRLHQLAMFFNVEVGWFFQGGPVQPQSQLTVQSPSFPIAGENGQRSTVRTASAHESIADNYVSEGPPQSTDPNCADIGATNDSKHILLVDDEPDVRRLTGAFLRKAGFRVSEASGGDDVLARLAAGERFDALVTDYAMAGLSGLGLIETMREIAPALPVLIVTGHSRDRDLIAGLPPKVQILAKPYSRNLFLAYIERLVGLPHRSERPKEDINQAPLI